MRVAKRAERVRVIGPVEIIGPVDGKRPRKQVRRLIALLVAAGSAGMGMEPLAEELWDGRPPKEWEAALRNAIAETRLALGPESIETKDGRYSLALDERDIDAWQLLASARGSESNSTDVEILSEFRPFEGLVPSDAIWRMTMALNTARLDLLEELQPASVVDQSSLIAELAEQLRRDPFDVPLSEAVLRLFLRFGKHGQALTLIDELEAELQRELGTGLSETLLILQKEARYGSRQSVSVAPLPHPRQALPPVLAVLADRPLTKAAQADAEQLADRLAAGSPRPVAITGAAGIGKTRFAAAVAQALYKNGAHIAFGRGIEGVSVKYAPLLEAFPAFRKSLLGSDNDSRAWMQFLEAVEQTEGNRPLWLFVDDAQLLDVSSIKLMEFAASTDLPRKVGLVSIGQSDRGSASWIDYLSRLSRDPVGEEVQLHPLELADVEELVQRRWPSVSSHTTMQAARDVERASGGLPLLANLLTDRLVGESLRLSGLDHYDGRNAVGSTLQLLAPRLRRTAEACAMFPESVQAAQVAAVLDWEPQVAADALDELVDLGVLVELEGGSYAFSHGLLREGASALTSKRWSRIFHHALLDDAPDEVERAKHALGAVPLVPPEKAVEMATGAAALAVREGRSRQALELLDGAERFTKTLTAEHEGVRAIALARIGAVEASRAARQRCIAGSTNPSDALKVVLECLGFLDQQVFLDGLREEIESFDLEKMPRIVQFQASIAIARIAALDGDIGDAEASAEIARQAASDSEEHAIVALTEWFIHSPLDGRRNWRSELGSAGHEVADPLVLSRLHQAEAIELGRSGDFGSAGEAAARSQLKAIDAGDRVRQWQNMLFDAMLLQFDGRWDEARAAVDRAANVGLVLEIAAAPAARAAQLYFDAMVHDELPSVAASLGVASPDIAGSDLARAAMARVLFEAGECSAALQQARPVLDLALARRNIDSLPIVWTLAPLVLADSELGESREACRRLASQQRGKWTLLGSGFVARGPVDQLIALLDRDASGLRSVRSRLPTNGPWRELLDRDLRRVVD